MKATLVFTGLSGYGFSNFGKFGWETAEIHHGLALIGACAKAKGFDIDLIDLRRLKGWRHFRKEVIGRKPDVVGITMMSVEYESVMRCVDIIKDIDPTIKVIVGGAHPSLATQDVAKNEKIDFIMVGEGEISFVDLLMDIKNNTKSQRIIVGIKPDVEALPFAEREMFGYDEVVGFSIEGLKPPCVSIIAGRGCMYNCSFCQPAERSIFGKKVRRRSVDNVIKELTILKERYNFSSLMIHDDCLIEDVNWVNEFCQKYPAAGFTQTFYCQGRANIICRHEEVIGRMAEAGLSIISIGFESGNQRVLNFLRKGTTVEQNLKAAEICKKYKIKIWANYMMGLPTETKEEVMDTVNMIKKIKPNIYSPAFYTPHPGSDLYEYCIKHDLSLIKDHIEYRRNPGAPKIKGVDYDFLNWAVAESMELTKLQRFIRKVGSLKVVRSLIVKMASKVPALADFIYRTVRKIYTN
ncbi:MAG: hypothetical protein A2X87_04515 [Deltaproteobacteria bacterium GWC2_42_51]|nr:MAG: hypothetical protein A2056_04085 [Deltaproteobacteria bacterium GWA2_42_85]OGP32362.1 MAG: hypothetical protein A2X87_04515 [Deltaproteobacteria bacterium GWC2_42_51]OGP38529.1 MAG: hypothetical protein A2090_03540 [Deltaproteobacteria bacterium GWD2_42_10]OGP48095.1 MAG: hypothetical protein A2022_02140 [Deltaproteobacteria bacterium GWF2_42_12]OGQ24832.1 MAG: hypothetical protein A3D29_08080 [Deltaproteobacteria bacterium RIFCSPHIGHO2_02_FULL_42_44]OGQ36746.1 MAG: hypothetical protei